MCGLTGVVRLDGGPAADRAVLRRMTSALAHRGPDSEGEFVADGVAIGFRRLGIVDLANGHQPYRSPDGAVVSVCNGEVYNHRALRKRLRALGHVFRSECDTEVLIPLYHEYGAELTNHLDGQFAFALYDTRKRTLVLARDHAGVIPLFYAVVAGRLVFGSEIKAILAHPDVPRAVDLRGLDQVLTLPGLVSPTTMFAGVHSLRPGERLIAGPGGIRLERYWDLDYPPDGEAPVTTRVEDHAEEVRERLSRAVRERLMADVPVGVYLSGGLDSTLIGALMREAEPDRAWPSYSVSFADGHLDERGYQRLAARELGTRHHEVDVSGDDVGTWLRAMVRHAETPVRESYNVCSLLLARRARSEGTVVVLSGEGADELFGGYPGYRFDSAAALARRGSALDEHFEREIRDRMWGADLAYEQDQLPALDFRRELYQEDLAAGLAEFAVTEHRLVDADKLVGRHPLHQRSYLDFHLRLADHLLGDHGDRMALASAVEARYPFLARDVIDHARGIPAELMLRDNEEKAVLRRAAAGLVPPGILARPKFGFRGHTSSHLLGAEWFGDLISPATVRKQGYFNPEVVTALADRQRAGTDPHPHLDVDHLLVVATFALLIEEFDLPCLG
ncbi:asparagine synthase (glutamine-hydrolyzing) [Amycolatopsis coloradensis]|uniref:asparagine synthase (glutamine-hydrolyzing) n=1 Tax=Amycolatopsis coloradensis TaxID=76021 RepID=A0A1R0KH81_9PSEU|nr:asparagine synthase (glutamine-hydrolyzing) [Amycolatopsis coloradensis]OLZ45021.1 asparagine synthase (glutamine-hydrolyzing) [Amycolatopsis coloradensis]